MAFHYKQFRHIQQCDVSDDQHSALVFDDKVIKFTCIYEKRSDCLLQWCTSTLRDSSNYDQQIV